MINRQVTRGTGTKPTKKAPPKTKAAKAWHGDEVRSSPGPGSSAEDAALRAEGNEPVRAVDAVRDADPGTFIERGPARRPRADDPDAAENVEEKRQSAAEEHAAQSSRHVPYGKL